MIDCIPTHIVADTIVQWSVCAFDVEGDYITEIGILNNRGERVIFTDDSGWHQAFDTVEDAISDICFRSYTINPNKLN